MPITLMPIGASMIGDSDTSSTGDWFLWSGMASLAGPPVVHWAHGNVGRGFLSLGGIVGGAVLGGGIAAAAEKQSGPKAGDAILGGALVGIALWGAADVIFFAYDDEPVEQSTAVSPWLSPAMSSNPGAGAQGEVGWEIAGMQVGALGRF